MRVTLSIVGCVLVVFGGIWFLQGIGVLPGSFMTGQIRWAVYGGIAVAAGISILVAQLFRQPRSHRVRAPPLRKSPPQLLYIVPIKCRSLCHVVGPPALGTPYQLPRIVVTHVCRKLTPSSCSAVP
jgi:hypothetical protein